MLLALEWSRTDRFANAWCCPAPGHRARPTPGETRQVQPDGDAGWLRESRNWAHPSPISRSQPARLSKASWTGPRLSRPQITAIQSEKTARDSEWLRRSELDRDLEADSRVGAGFVDLAVQRVCVGHETPSRLGQRHSARPRSNGGLWCIAPTPGFVG